MVHAQNSAAGVFCTGGRLGGFLGESSNYAFKPTAGETVRFERMLPASGGLTRR